MTSCRRNRYPKRRLAAALLSMWVVVLAPSMPAAAQASAEEPQSLLLIMDSSGSMNAGAGGGVTKIEAAKDALLGLVDELPADALVGLRVYGHRVRNTDKRRGCKDTELVVPVGPLDRQAMKQTILSFDAKGFTPIGLSLRKAARDLPQEGERTMVLVSDGIDTCAPPPPCKVARRIVRSGIDLRIHTIGFQVNPQARRQLRCIARVARGTYEDARSAAELSDRLTALSLRAFRRYDPQGTPVDGGLTPDQAPVLVPGRYVDELAQDQELWYAVDLAPGQSLAATATLVGKPRGAGTWTGIFEFEIHNPELNAPLDAAGSTSFSGREHASVAVRTPAVGVDPESIWWSEAGRHYLYAHLAGAPELGAVRYKLEFNFSIDSQAASASEDQGRGVDDGPLARGPDGDESTSWIATAAALALAGAVVGALGALLLARSVAR